MITSITMSNYIFNTNTDIYSKLVYAAIKKFSDKEGRCFPSRNTLSQLCNISISTLRKAINTLVDAKVLDKEFRYRENRSQTSNLYTLSPLMLPGDYYYFKVRADIFELELNNMEAVVYMYFCSCANADNECHPSIKQIAEACGISLTSTKTSIKKLIEKNLILKINQFRADGGKRNNLYKIISEEDINEKENDIMLKTDYTDAAHEQNAAEEITDKDPETDKKDHTEKSVIIKNTPVVKGTSMLEDEKYQNSTKTKIRGDIFEFKLSNDSLLVYLYISTFNECNNGNMPSYEQIASKCKIRVQRVEKIISELERLGLIAKVDKKNNRNTIDNIKPPPWSGEATP
mgnify:CR=1 FL=1